MKMGFFRHVKVYLLTGQSTLKFFFQSAFICALKMNQSLQMLNVLSTILLIVRSFVKVVKLYRWDKTGLYHAYENYFCIDSVSIFHSHVILAILFYLFRIFLNINLPR